MMANNPKRGAAHWLTLGLVVVILAAALFLGSWLPTNGTGPALAADTPSPPPELTPVDSGPQVWIEYPREGQVLPLEKWPFVVYAADPLNVDQIDVQVNGQPLPQVQPMVLIEETGRRMVRLDQLWQPEQEGEHIVEARARNSAGTYGELTHVKFCVGSCQPGEATPTPTPAGDALVTITPTPAPGAQYDLYVRRMDFNTDTPAVGEKVQLSIMLSTNTYPTQGPFFPASHFRWRQGPGFPWQEEVCPDNTQYASCEKTVEFTYGQTGSYVVEVEADSRNQILETDKTNNIGSWAVTVGQAPTPTLTATPAPEYDLYVRRMDFSTDTPLVGEKVQLFIMIATDIYPAQGPFFPASHFRWRQGPGYNWQEVVCPDNMQYASCTETVEFSYNQAGSYLVEVEADNRNEIPETDESNNLSGWTVTVGQAPTETPTPLPEMAVDFYANPPYVDGGACTTLYWSVEGVQAIYLDGQPQVGQGSKQVCPCVDTTYTLEVLKLDNSTEFFNVTVLVYGSCEQPTEEPPDENPPVIETLGLRWESDAYCEFYGHATIRSSGPVWAEFHFRMDDGGWGSQPMSDLGGGYFETGYGEQIMMTTGYIEYYVIAGDTNENTNESATISGDYWMCGGG